MMVSSSPRYDISKVATWLAVIAALLACLAFSHESRAIKTRWPGVPPSPSQPAALMFGFGDRGLSYYVTGLTLQNMGDIGGRMTPLKAYDMNHVAEWLWLTYAFDTKARYAPLLGGYYFSATQDPSKLRPVIEYLGVAGNSTENGLWRLLAQGVYLARFKLKDQELALQLAYKLAALDGPDLPIWTKQMPGFVMSNVGQKQASRDLFLTLLATSKNISLQEINFMCAYIQDHLREKNDNLDSNDVWKARCAGRDF